MLAAAACGKTGEAGKPAEGAPADAAAGTPAAGAVPVIAIIRAADWIGSEWSEDALKVGLQESELEQGRDYQFKVSSAQGDLATLPSLIDAAVDAKAKVIVTLQDETLQAAVQRVKTLPIVFNILSDPFAAGAGTTDSNHLANITGVYSPGFGDPDQAKRVELIKRVVPKVKRVGILFSPGEPLSVGLKDKMTAAAKKAGLTVEAVPINSVSEGTEAASALVGKKVDGHRDLRQRGPRRVREHHPGGQGAQDPGVLPVAVRDPQGRHGGALPRLPGGRGRGGQDDRPHSQGREPGRDPVLPPRDHQGAGQPGHHRRQMKMVTAHVGSSALVRLTGRLDGEWSRHLADTLDELLRDGLRSVILDMSQVDYISTPGVQVLGQRYRDFSQLRGELRISTPSPVVLNALTADGLIEQLLLLPGDERVAGGPGRPSTFLPRAASEFTGDAWHVPAATGPAGQYEISRRHLAGELECRVVGQPDGFAAGHRAEDCRTIAFTPGAFALGIGAIGDSLEDTGPRFGELIGVSGTVAYLPTDGALVPDYLTATAPARPPRCWAAGWSSTGPSAT